METLSNVGSYLVSLIRGRVYKVFFNFSENVGCIQTNRGVLYFAKNKYYDKIKSVYLYKTATKKVEYIQIDKAAYSGTPGDFECEYAEIEIENNDESITIIKVDKNQDIQTTINEYFERENENTYIVVDNIQEGSEGEENDERENSEKDSSDDEDEEDDDDDEDENEDDDDDEDDDEEDEELDQILQNTDDEDENNDECHGDSCPIDINMMISIAGANDKKLMKKIKSLKKKPIQQSHSAEEQTEGVHSEEKQVEEQQIDRHSEEHSEKRSEGHLESHSAEQSQTGAEL